MQKFRFALWLSIWLTLLAGVARALPVNELCVVTDSAIYPVADTVRRGDTLVYQITVEPKAKLTYLTLELNLPNFDYTENSYPYTDFVGEAFIQGWSGSDVDEKKIEKNDDDETITVKYKFKNNFFLTSNQTAIIQCTLLVKDVPCPKHILIPLKMNARLFAREFDVSSPASDHDDQKFLDCFPDIIFDLGSIYDTLCNDMANHHTVNLTNHYDSQKKEAIVLDSVDLYVHFPNNLSITNDSLTISPSDPATTWSALPLIDLFDGVETLSYRHYRIYNQQPNQTVTFDYDSEYQPVAGDLFYEIRAAYDYNDGFYMSTLLRDTVWLGTRNFAIEFANASGNSDTLSCGAYLGLNVLVKNLGLCPVDSTHPIEVTIRDESGAILDSFWIHDLQAMNEKMFALDLSGSYFECGTSHTLTAEVNPAHDPTEIRYDDNIDIVTFDFGITDLNLNFTHVSILEPEPVVDSCGVNRYADCDRHIASLTVTDQNHRPLNFLADSCWDLPNPSWWPGFLLTSFSRSWGFANDSIRLMRASGSLETNQRSVLFVIDHSGSMGSTEMNSQSRMALTREAVIELIQSGSCADTFAVLIFDDEFEYIQPFTSDKNLLVSQVNSIQDRGGTYLWTALGQAADICVTHPGEEIIIVINDGSAADSETKATVIQAMLDFGIPVFALGMGQDGWFDDLEELAGTTGGYFYRIENAGYSASMLQSLCEMGSGGYLLSYPSPITEHTGETVTLKGDVAYQGAETFNQALSDRDSIDYKLCLSACDLVMTKSLTGGYDLDSAQSNAVPWVAMNKDGLSGTLTYRLSIFNNGQLACDTEIVVIDTLPDSRYGEVISMQPQGQYDSGNNTISWTLPSLGANGYASFQYDFLLADTLDAALPPQIINICVAECNADENLSNNLDTVIVLIKSEINPPIIRCYRSTGAETYYFYPRDTVLFKAVCVTPKTARDWDLSVSDPTGTELPVSKANTSLYAHPVEVGRYILPSKLDNGLEADPYRVRITTYNNLYIPEGGDLQRDTTLQAEARFFNQKLQDNLRLDRNTINPLKNEYVVFYIDLSLPQEVEIDVYNIAGEEVWHYTGWFNDGMNQLQWNGRDASSEPVHPGIYVIRFKGKTISDAKAIQKLMINWK